jgi:glutaredoxin 3
MPKPVRIYTVTYCGYCHRAKQLLDQRGIAFEEIDVTADLSVRQWLVAKTGRRTVPQILVGDEAIGGYDELRALDDAGRLDALVA